MLCIDDLNLPINPGGPTALLSAVHEETHTGDAAMNDINSRVRQLERIVLAEQAQIDEVLLRTPREAAVLSSSVPATGETAATRTTWAVPL